MWRNSDFEILTENEKDNDSRGGQATQALIQRRRRPKRRSTGVCNVSAEDGDAERQDSPVDGDEVSSNFHSFYSKNKSKLKHGVRDAKSIRR